MLLFHKLSPGYYGPHHLPGLFLSLVGLSFFRIDNVVKVSGGKRAERSKHLTLILNRLLFRLQFLSGDPLAEEELEGALEVVAGTYK